MEILKGKFLDFVLYIEKKSFRNFEYDLLVHTALKISISVCRFESVFAICLFECFFDACLIDNDFLLFFSVLVVLNSCCASHFENVFWCFWFSEFEMSFWRLPFCQVTFDVCHCKNIFWFCHFENYCLVPVALKMVLWHIDKFMFFKFFKLQEIQCIYFALFQARKILLWRLQNCIRTIPSGASACRLSHQEIYKF